MNTVTDCAAQECDLVVLHDRTMMPLIFRAHEDMIGFHKLGTKKLTLHDEYWIKGSSNEGGVAFPFHDDFEFVNDKYPGLLDISRVKGTPMFLSLPHFHSTSGDTYFKYGRSFQGLEPDASAHASSMLVEYALGLAVSTDIKLQYNIVLPPRAGMFQNEMKVRRGARGERGKECYLTIAASFLTLASDLGGRRRSHVPHVLAAREEPHQLGERGLVEHGVDLLNVLDRIHAHPIEHNLHDDHGRGWFVPD